MGESSGSFWGGLTLIALIILVAEWLNWVNFPEWVIWLSWFMLIASLIMSLIGIALLVLVAKTRRGF